MHSWGGCRRAHEQRDQILRRAELVVQVAVVKEPGSAQWDETTNLAQLIEDTAHARGIVEIVDGVRVREMVVAPLYDLARLDHPAARDLADHARGERRFASAWRSSPESRAPLRPARSRRAAPSRSIGCAARGPARRTVPDREVDGRIVGHSGPGQAQEQKTQMAETQALRGLHDVARKRMRDQGDESGERQRRYDRAPGQDRAAVTEAHPRHAAARDVETDHRAAGAHRPGRQLFG